MYKDSYGNISCADEITCPYCDEELSDSWEYVPSDGGGEKSWDQECPECGKTFHVAFDMYNQSDGFECSKICKRHDFEWKGDVYNKHDTNHWISRTSNVYRCRKCGEIKFVSTRPDGTEYSRKEVRDWEAQRKKRNFIKNNPELNPCTGEKVIEIRFHDTSIIINSDVPEGNADVFKAINRLLSRRGFTVGHEDRYVKDYPSLKRWHRYLRRGWLECYAEFSRNKVEYDFYQSVYLEPGRDSGRYGSHKYDLMDTSMKTEFRSVRKLIVDYLNEKYTVKKKDPEIYDSHGYVCVHDGRIIREYSQKDFESNYRENLDRDGLEIHNGDTVGHYDDHGRLWVGRLYNRCGSYKYLVHNDRSVSLAAPRKCFRLTGDEPRKILPEKSSSVLKRLLEDAVKAQDFEKAIIYRDRLKEIGG